LPGVDVPLKNIGITPGKLQFISGEPNDLVIDVNCDVAACLNLLLIGWTSEDCELVFVGGLFGFGGDKAGVGVLTGSGSWVGDAFVGVSGDDDGVCVMTGCFWGGEACVEAAGDDGWVGVLIGSGDDGGVGVLTGSGNDGAVGVLTGSGDDGGVGVLTGSGDDGEVGVGVACNDGGVGVLTGSGGGEDLAGGFASWSGCLVGGTPKNWESFKSSLSFRLLVISTFLMRNPLNCCIFCFFSWLKLSIVACSDGPITRG